MSNKIKLIPFAEKFKADYRNFAKRNWGKDCYQASDKYLQWLYQQNPCGASVEDFLIAINNHQEVVGSIHKLNIPWLINGEKIIIPAIHNLLVEQKYRTGNGLFLITASLKGADNIFIPGVNPPLSDAYRMLRSQELAIQQYRKVIRPFTGSTKLLCHKIFNIANSKVNLNGKILNIQTNSFKFTFAPDEYLIKRAVAAIKQRDSKYQQKIAWDLELFKWRFFAKNGPQHLMIYDDSKDKIDFALISIGYRKGLTIARLIENSCSAPQDFKQLFNSIQNILKKLKVDLLISYNIENNLQQLLPQVGLKPVSAQKTQSYIYHRDRNNLFQDIYLSVAAGDYGLESINSIKC